MNTEKTSIKFHFEGEIREYVLVYDFNKFCDAETETGANILSWIGGNNRTASQLRAVLYACLKTDNPKVLLSEAGDMLNRDTGGLLACLTALIGAAVEGTEEEDETPPATPALANA